ncbi:MAG: hypothetical protein ACFN0J_05585 [Segatella salivae]
MNYKVYSWATLSLSALLMFSACANDDIVNSENEVTLNGHKLNITINEETFEAEKPTRATQVLHRDTIDMGDGLIAEVSIEPDKAASTPQPAKTRAAMSEGHYTIYAVDAAGNRVADELSGTVSNGKFIPDANKKIHLDPGTYTFVCHNDAFTKTATGLSISSGISTYPMMGTVTKTLSGGNETVSFNMKHLAARIRAQVTTYTAYAKMKSNGTYLTAVDNKFSQMEFDNRGAFQQRVSSGPTLYTRDGIESFSNDGAKPYSYYVEPFDVISSYSYIPLAENENIPANGLIYTFNGSYHGKEKQKSITIDTPLERNHTYLVKLTMKTKDPLYLYQDGTVGYLGDKEVGTREPIALVIKEKSTTENGYAMALKNAGYFYHKSIDVQHKFQTAGGFGTDEMNGYEITHTLQYISSLTPQSPTQSPGEIESFPAFYNAAHFNPGPNVTGSNVGKWFLPSSGFWRRALVRYGELAPNEMWTGMMATFSLATTATWNSSKFIQCLTQAGGDLPLGYYCLSGTAEDGGGAFLHLTSDKTAMGSGVNTLGPVIDHGFVRPFIYF